MITMNIKTKKSLYENIMASVAKTVKSKLNEYEDWDDEEDWDEEEWDDESESPKYSLIGIDGNAFSVMGYVAKCMKQEHMSYEEIDNYRKDAMSGDYNHLLMVSVEMIEMLNEQ